MSQGVSRLKELLFERESESIQDLRQRIEAMDRASALGRAEVAARLAKLAEADERARGALEARLKAEMETGRGSLARSLEPVLARAGTDARFRQSVAAVLDQAMRDAEATRHRELSQAMAPLVVRTIKTEIRNSQDEMVEVLYPITGRMVKAYIAAAMKDLVQQINRRLEQNPVLLRLRSLSTGRPVAELAMADAARLEVVELFLIRRGTGELLVRWPEAEAGSNSDHVLGGTLAAINEFAGEALKTDGSALRHVDLGSAQVYLRASQTHLLAARCIGTAPAAVEQILDDELLAVVDSLKTSAPGADEPRVALASTAERLESRIAERQTRIAGSGANPLRTLLVLLAIPLLAWGGWTLWSQYRTGAVRSAAQQVLSTTPELTGYPLTLDVEQRGGVVTLTGLAPSPAVKSALIARLGAALPGTEVRDRLSAVPGGTPDAEPQIAMVRRDLTGLESGVRRDLAGLGEGVRRDMAGLAADLRVAVEHDLERAALRRGAERAAARLSQIGPDLRRLAAGLSPAEGRARVDATATLVTEGARETAALAERASGARDAAALAEVQARLAAWSQRIGTAASEMALLLAVPGPTVAAPATPTSSETPRATGDAAERLLAEVERLASLSLANEQLAALRRQIVQPSPTPEDRLEAFARRNAVFFANGTDYRDPAAAEAMLDALAPLIMETRLVVRVAGYTDERGGQQRNVPLALARADRIVDALVTRGVPRGRLVAVGRNNSRDLSPSVGPDSPNRRVELEIGFAGEGAR